jgi:hypothetical protein
MSPSRYMMVRVVHKRKSHSHMLNVLHQGVTKSWMTVNETPNLAFVFSFNFSVAWEEELKKATIA